MNEMNLIDDIPLEYLQNITLEQRKKLETVNLTSRNWTIGIIGSIGASTVIALSIAGKFLIFFLRTQRAGVNVNITHNNDRKMNECSEDKAS